MRCRRTTGSSAFVYSLPNPEARTMWSVELTPTLRAHLDALDPYLEDPTVSEILVAGPDRAFVTQDGASRPVEIALGEARLRSMADRLLRAMGPRPREQSAVQVGRISDDLEVTIIGPPRGQRCPMVRVVRRTAAPRTLDDLVTSNEANTRLRGVPEARASVLFTGPHGAPRIDLVVAMVAEWSAYGRVLVLDAEDGPLATSGAADLVLDPEVGGGAIQAVAADAVVAFDPSPTTWSDLLASGRPVVASIEAPDGETGLMRVMARVLAGRAELSRAAAEALVESAFSVVVELSAAPGAAPVLRIGRAAFRGDGLAFETQSSGRPVRVPDTTDLPAPAHDVMSPASAPNLEVPEPAEDAVQAAMLDLIPEDLVSKSFVHELDDPTADSVDLDTGDVDETARGDATPAFAVKVPVIDVPDSKVMTDGEDQTQFAPDPQSDERTTNDPAGPMIDGEVMAAFDAAVEAVEAAESLVDVDALEEEEDVEVDEDPTAEPFDEMQTDDRARSGPKRRVPNERTPTEIGPPNGNEGSAWAAKAYTAAAGVGNVDIPEDEHRELSSPFERFDDQDIRTSAQELAPSLDPFDALDAPTGHGDMRALAERTLGVGARMPAGLKEPSVDDVYDSRVHAEVEDVGAPRLGSGLVEESDEEWDAEGPSLIIDGPPSLARRGPDPDHTRTGALGPDATAPVPNRPSRRPRQGGSEHGASNDREAQEERRPVRRKPPGRSLD